MADPQFFKHPSLPLAQNVFTATNPYATQSARDASVQSIKDAIREHKMAPFYKYLAHPSTGILNPSGQGSAQHPPRLRRGSSTAPSILATKKPAFKVDLPWDEKLYEELVTDNEKELEAIKREESEAEEKAGETEVQAARTKRTEFYARVCDKVSSHASNSCGIQVCLTRIRIKHFRHSRPSLRKQVFWEPKLTYFSPSSGLVCFSETRFWCRKQFLERILSWSPVATGIVEIV